MHNEGNILKNKLEYEDIFNALPDAAFIHDLDGCIIDVNDQTINLIGYSKKELVKMSLTEVVGNTAMQFFLDKPLKKGSSQFDGQLIKAKQKLCEVEYFSNRITLEDRIAVLTIAKEKPNRQKMSQASYIQHKCCDLINEINNVVFEVDKNYHITFISQAIENLTGHKSDGYLGKRIMEFIHPEHNNRLKKSIKEIIKSGKYSNEFQILIRNGKYLWAQVCTTLIRSRETGKIIGIKGILKDITQSKLFMQKLIQTKEIAEESENLKLSFLANMSHEIRTPLNAIIGFSDIIKSNKLAEEETEEYLNIIDINSKRLLNLINDVIIMSLIESNQVKLNKVYFSLQSLFHELNITFTDRLKEEGKVDKIKLFFKNMLNINAQSVYSDRFRINQILSNLIDNSIKYSQSGVVEIACRKYKHDLLLFYVKDKGIGIDDSIKHLIFKSFAQADNSTTRKFEGAGLGLSISKKLVELLGGEIWYESEKDKGSTFYFTIQSDKHFVTSTKEAYKSSENEKIKFKNKTILIAEDDEHNMILLKKILVPYGLNIITCSNGKDCIERFCSEKHIDLILMNEKMPIMSGHEATKEIRRLDAEIPIIAVTAYTIDVKNIIEKGYTDYITKPYIIMELVDKITTYL